MANPITKLNEESVRRLPLGSGIHRDSVVPGFFVVCHKGTRSYAVQTDLRRNGRHVKSIRKKIGRCDRMGLAEARRLAKQTLARIQGGEDVTARPDETGITLRQALEEHKKGRKLRPRTVESYEQHLDGYLSGFRSRAIVDISRADVRDLMDHLTEQHGRTACASALRTLRLLVNTARRVDETIGGNPVDAVRVPIPPRRKVDELDVAEWWAATEALSPQMRRLHRTFLLCGARRSSVLLLRRDDVDLERGVLTFSHMKTSDDALLYPIGEFLGGMLREQLGQSVPMKSDWLWPADSKSGHVMEPARCGLPGPHALRHSFRTLSIEAGVPFSEASLLIGHRMPGVSSSYVHAGHLVEHLRKYSQAIEDLILVKARPGAQFQSHRVSKRDRTAAMTDRA